jgi:DNA-binding MarR family transcriptional regulator
MNNLNLTELETKVLTAFIDGLYAEPGFSDVDAKDIANMTKIDIKSVRGVLASLVKKGIIYIYDNEAGYYIIYLNTGFYYLHPRWKDEVGC